MSSPQRSTGRGRSGSRSLRRAGDFAGDREIFVIVFIRCAVAGMDLCGVTAFVMLVQDAPPSLDNRLNGYFFRMLLGLGPYGRGGGGNGPTVDKAVPQGHAHGGLGTAALLG